MKPKTKKMSTGFRWGKAALLAGCALALSSLQALAVLPVNLGKAGPNDPHNWAVFSLGGMTEQDTLSGMTDVIGNVGVVDGNLSLSGSATIHGMGFLQTGHHYKHSGSSTVTGGVQIGTIDAYLSQGKTDAMNASTAAFNLVSTNPALTKIRSSMSLNAGSGNVVLKLTDFVLSDNAVVTLNGTSTSSFTIDISHNFQLSGGSKVVLSGGLTWNNVLFNVKNDAMLSGHSQLTGVILAVNGTTDLDGSSKVMGEVISKNVQLSGGSNITRPPIVSP